MEPAIAGSEEQGSVEAVIAQSEAARESFIFAVGRVEPRFPTLGLEKEFRQTVGVHEGVGERIALRRAIGERTNRFLLRQLSWVFMVGGVETYMLAPRDPVDLEFLADTLREDGTDDEFDLVIGTLGAVLTEDPWGARGLSIVVFDRLLSFTVGDLLTELARSAQAAEEKDANFQALASDLFERLVLATDNTGLADHYRAANYIALRYPEVYKYAARSRSRGLTLASVAARSIPFSGHRRLVDVIFSYSGPDGEREERFVRVDVTEEYPFLVQGLSPMHELQYR